MKEDKRDIIENILSNWKMPENQSKDQSWSELQKSIENKDQTPVIPIKRKTRWVAVASVAAVLFMAVWWGLGSGSEITTVNSFASVVDHQLPDGSLVELNAGSQIEYDAENWEDERSLKLIGEAYFDVEKGSRFVVNTSSGSVEVLGTEFNVFSREEGFSVKCYEGKVAVRSKESEVKIQKGEEARMLAKMLTVSSFVPSTPSWKDGVFVWEDEDLAIVLKEVERQYGVKCELKEGIRRKYSGSFEKMGLTEVMSLICEPLGLEFDNSTVGIIRITEIENVNEL